MELINCKRSKINSLLICQALLLIFLFLSVGVLGQNSDTTNTKTEIVYFDFNRSDLKTEEIVKLDQTIDFIKSKIAGKISIVGHTDMIGGESYNLNLSKARAESVSKYLVDKGIDKAFIQISFLGESKPLESNETEQGRRKNRRAEIVIQFSEIPLLVENKLIKKDSVLVDIVDTSDYVFVGRQGTRIVMKNDFFAPYKIGDVKFEIREFFTPCQIISEGLNTMDNAGGCLQTGGMVLFNVTINSKEIKPDGSQKLEVWIPTNKPDDKMEVYIPENGTWKSYDKELQIKELDGKYYYVFETELISGCNIDRLVGPCPDNGPIVKTRMSKNQRVFFNYGDLTITRGKQIKEKTHRMPKFQSGQTPKIVAVATKDKYLYIADKPLDQIKYNVKRNKYILRSKDYKKVEKFPDNGNLAEYLCGNVF